VQSVAPAPESTALPISNEPETVAVDPAFNPPGQSETDDGASATEVEPGLPFFPASVIAPPQLRPFTARHAIGATRNRALVRPSPRPAPYRVFVPFRARRPLQHRSR
jgi:hypothetical protein